MYPTRVLSSYLMCFSSRSSASLKFNSSIQVFPETLFHSTKWRVSVDGNIPVCGLEFRQIHSIVPMNQWKFVLPSSVVLQTYQLPGSCVDFLATKPTEAARTVTSFSLVGLVSPRITVGLKTARVGRKELQSNIVVMQILSKTVRVQLPVKRKPVNLAQDTPSCWSSLTTQVSPRVLWTPCTTCFLAQDTPWGPQHTW